MIEVRIMQVPERMAVESFINAAMRAQYGCDAHSLPEVVFVAWDGGAPKGTLGLSCAENGVFPVECCYALNGEHAVARMVLADRHRVVQFGRWIAPNPYVATLLLQKAVRHATQDGRVWGIGEAKPAVARRFGQLGIRTILLSNRIDFASIPERVMPYYVRPPAPAMYGFSLREIVV